jgi:hypothetical protein
MNKKIVAILLVGAFILSGCALADRFEEAKDAYLEERVTELLAEDVTAEPVEETAEPEETPEPIVVETEVVETEVVETEEVLPEATEEATPEAEAVDDTEDDEMDDDADAEVSEADATPEVVSEDPGVYLGDPDWLDEMKPGDYNWNLETDTYMSAAYDNGTLQLKALSEVMGWRIASTPVLGDAYIEAVVKMGACSTSDGYGLVFRVPEQVAYNQGYFFGITCDGKYSLRVWNGLVGANGVTTWLQYPKLSEFIVKGKDASNTLGVMTVGDDISLYINGELVAEFEDDTYPQGFFGMFINRDNTENLTINIDRASYWTDPLDE